MPAASATATPQSGNAAVSTSRGMQNHVDKAADTQQKVAELQAALEAATSRAHQQKAEMEADRSKLQRLTVSSQGSTHLKPSSRTILWPP